MTDEEVEQALADLCRAVHPQDLTLPNPIPEDWHVYRRVCARPEGHGEHPDRPALGAHESPQGDRWDDAPAPSAPNLPAPIGGPDGTLDADALRQLAPVLRRDLIASLRHAATLHRQARGTVVVPEDTYPLVRRVVSAGESLRSVAEAFLAAAAEADAIAEEEALTVSGAEHDGTLVASLFVPDGEGQRIAVRPDYAAGSSTYDVASLVGWLIDDEVADVKGEQRAEARRRYESRQAAADPNGEGVEPEPLDPLARATEAAWYESDARIIAGNVVSRLLRLGRYTPAAREVEALRKRLAEQQRDADAAVIRQVRTVGARTYRGVKVTREEAK
jgi:hypothetical protein